MTDRSHNPLLTNFHNLKDNQDVIDLEVEQPKKKLKKKRNSISNKPLYKRIN